MPARQAAFASQRAAHLPSCSDNVFFAWHARICAPGPGVSRVRAPKKHELSICLSEGPFWGHPRTAIWNALLACSTYLMRRPADHLALRTLMAALTIVVFARAVDAQETSGPPPADLLGQINYLARQLYGVPLDESAPLTSEIEKLVLDHMEQWLRNHTTSPEPTDVDVRRELERVFDRIQYPVYAWPAVFARRWKGATLYGVGYTLGWSDYNRSNVIGLIESRGGEVRQKAITHFVPHTDLHYRFLTPPGRADDFWFLTYGTRLGKSQRRLTARLFSFDGKSLRSLWQVEDAYDAQIRVGPDWVSIRYLKEDEYVRETARGRKPPRYESTYRATATGLELESTREVPF